jgi:hypothetical protein
MISVPRVLLSSQEPRVSPEHVPGKTFKTECRFFVPFSDLSSKGNIFAVPTGTLSRLEDSTNGTDPPLWSGFATNRTHAWDLKRLSVLLRLARPRSRRPTSTLLISEISIAPAVPPPGPGLPPAVISETQAFTKFKSQMEIR